MILDEVRAKIEWQAGTEVLLQYNHKNSCIKELA
jgi:hypothetical protein